jgi:hypothetical protein
LSGLLALASAASIAACASPTNTSRGGNPDHRTTDGGPAGTTGSGGSGGSGTNTGGSQTDTGGSSASGGSGPPSPACDYVPLQTLICATRIGDWVDGSSHDAFGGWQITFEGTVTDILPGSPACSGVVGYLSYTSTWYARIWDGVRGLEMGFPTASPIVKVGDVLNVVMSSFQPNGFAPLVSYTEIRTSNRRLLFWQATSGDVARLQTLPEVSVAEGPVLCEERGECGSWEARLTEMTSSGSSVVLRPGGKAHIGEYAVAAGGIANQTSYPSPCADWYVGIASALAVRTTLTDLTL